MKDLSSYRKSYEKSSLVENAIPTHPIELFAKWFLEAEEQGGTGEVNAMTVSTIGQDGFPKSRVVLLKEFSLDGFVFYTNYQSEKGRAIELNPNICLSFFWPAVERQVIIKGIAAKTSAAESDAYFNSRPEASRIGAIISDQSSEIPSRAELERKLTEFSAATINRPDHWGGYRITPVQMEFWQGRPNRLHDRIRFTLTDNRWEQSRLQP